MKFTLITTLCLVATIALAGDPNDWRQVGILVSTNESQQAQLAGAAMILEYQGKEVTPENIEKYATFSPQVRDRDVTNTTYLIGCYWARDLVLPVVEAEIDTKIAEVKLVCPSVKGGVFLKLSEFMVEMNVEWLPMEEEE